MASRRHFTLEEANSLVPWLTEKFASLQPLNHRLHDCSTRLEGLMRKIRANGGGKVEIAVAETQKEAEDLTREIGRVVEEITQRGILVRDPQTGLGDFPSIRAGREVFLCWRLGEPTVSYWHQTTTGYADRQPL